MMKKVTPTHRRNRPVQEFVDNNFALDRKIKMALADLKPGSQWRLMELPTEEDKERLQTLFSIGQMRVAVL